MRINRFIAQATGLSRRGADSAVKHGRVAVNGVPADIGYEVSEKDRVELDGKEIVLDSLKTIILNKPRGYVCSRNGQGSRTVYDLLPAELHNLKPVGRLDKDSSGLLLMTNDGKLANSLTHPSYQKVKRYEVKLLRPLSLEDEMAIKQGIALDDGPSKLYLKPLNRQRILWEVRISEGRNRQIRRTFGHLGYRVKGLHRTHFGEYSLDELPTSKLQYIAN